MFYFVLLAIPILRLIDFFSFCGEHMGPVAPLLRMTTSDFTWYFGGSQTIA